MKKLISMFVAIACLLSCTFAMSACSDNNANKSYKIGVLREDDSSGEAAAWEEYRKKYEHHVRLHNNQQLGI